ncbi:MAG: hypothetical protein ACLFWF_02255 [Alphaproteobacteria bacterium]
MNDTPKDRGKPDRRREREARLAEALRANLKRRKAQERGRAAGTDAPEDGDNSG